MDYYAFGHFRQTDGYDETDEQGQIGDNALEASSSGDKEPASNSIMSNEKGGPGSSTVEIDLTGDIHKDTDEEQQNKSC